MISFFIRETQMHFITQLEEDLKSYLPCNSRFLYPTQKESSEEMGSRPPPPPYPLILEPGVRIWGIKQTSVYKDKIVCFT